MPYEQKPNTGSLWRNENREADTHPTHKGDAVIDGKPYWMNAWVNETKGDPPKKYFRVSFKPKDEPRTESPARATDEEMDGDIPF